MWVASQPASFHLLYIGRARASLPPYAHSMRLCPPDDCLLAHFHIFQGSGSSECARGDESVNKSRAIALRVSTNSVWFLQHCQLIQFIMRESIRGKQEKRSKKLPRKSIQWYFAMYPRINRQVTSITLPSILASFFAFPATSDEENQRSKSPQAVSWCKGTKPSRTANALAYTILPDMDIREAGKVQKAEEAAPRTGQPLADIITIS